MLRRLLLLVVVVMMASPVSAAVILQVDFNSDQDGGGNSNTAGDPGASAAAHNQAGWSSYHANHEVAAEFTTAHYGGITVTPAWPNTTDNRVQQSIDRGAANDNTWDNSLGYLNLVTDWIGTDTRTANGGNGNWDGAAGTPTYMTLTLGGLGAGTYEWTSFHHDTEHCFGPFAVWLSTDGGTTFTRLADGLMTDGTTGGTPDSGTVYGGPDPYSLPSTYRTTFSANGVDNVVMRFAPYSNAAGAHRQIWGMNGFELNRVESNTAIVLTPANGATDVLRDETLFSWIPGQDAARHDVYLGTDYDDIDDGTTASVVYRGRQDANSFDPGRLELGQTYYWRVDEIAGDGTVAKGDIWSFTVEPVSIALAGSHIMATASGSNSANEGPEKTIDGSGLNADDQHSTNTNEMWLSAPVQPGEVAWIQYEFDKLYELHQMLVWNHNSTMESAIGFGARDVTIEYSQDGIDWAALDTTRELAQASGTGDYVANTTVDFDGVPARYVKIEIASNWGGALPRYGLSEVRFMVIPVAARRPAPASGATGVDPRRPLSWRAGREAASHEVYVGDDANAVAASSTPTATVAETTFDAGNLLELGKTYYWKVDEVNDQEAQPVWAGDVWSFTVQQYLVIDDFESYTNDSPNRVFQTWIDGMGFSADEFFPKGNPGNGTGSLVGYDPTAGNIMETATVHGGAQSMPVAYDSSVAPTSETERTFSAPQDWTRYGVKGLVIWFCGNPDNTASQMYVKVNGRKVAYGGDVDNLLRKPWHLWYIPLTQFTGVDLKKVTKLAIGFEGGTGLMFFDDIGLSPLDQQVVTPVKPNAANLLAYYAMEGNANDGTGGPAGTFGGSPTFAPGKVGQAISLNGATDYVLVTRSLDLPVYSAALWFRVEGGTGNRDLISIFNDAALHGALLEVESGGGLRFLHRAPVGVTTGDVNIRNSGTFDDGAWYHTAIVKSAETATLYVNGEQVGSAASTAAFDQALTKIALGMLKDPINTADARYLPGQIDEVYLYNRVLSQGEIASLAGLTKPFDK
jgi:hypothetical protein